MPMRGRIAPAVPALIRSTRANWVWYGVALHELARLKTAYAK